MPQLLFTTNPGLEDIVVAELCERAAAAGLDPAAWQRRPHPIAGRVTVETDVPAAAARPAIAGLRSVHHAMRPLARFELPADGALDAIHARVCALDLPELADRPPFRVTSKRDGTHDFTSEDVQRAAGAAVVAATGAPVDLRGFAVELRVDVVDSLCEVALQLTRAPLSQRAERPYRQRVALRTTVAYAAVRLGALGLEAPPRRVGDPFCGSGTLLLEAGAAFPDAELWGGDRWPAAAEGAAANLAAAGLEARAHIEVADARHLVGHWPDEAFDLLLANPPYGRRLGRRISFEGFYIRVLHQLRDLLAPGGRIVLLSDRRGTLRRAVAKAGGLALRHIRVVRTGGTHPAIFVLEKD